MDEVWLLKFEVRCNNPHISKRLVEAPVIAMSHQPSPGTPLSKEEKKRSYWVGLILLGSEHWTGLCTQLMQGYPADEHVSDASCIRFCQHTMPRCNTPCRCQNDSRVRCSQGSTPFLMESNYGPRDPASTVDPSVSSVGVHRADLTDHQMRRS